MGEFRTESGGSLGYPTTDELVTPDKEGATNHFQGGSIYWHPDTERAKRKLFEAWGALGWEKSYLDISSSDELATPARCGANDFRMGPFCHTGPWCERISRVWNVT
ncbi:MAG: hypothetical protein H6644_09900 [Caldilineaceae bacterium]|nr:hypothetical protein [Caldilineaceae bacterium]